MINRLPTKDIIIEARVNYIKRKAREIGMDPGWLWLYRNGFKRRVPQDIQQKIEDSDVFLFGGNDE